MSNELAKNYDFSQFKEELYPLLKRQVSLYTMGDSSYLPAEKVQELLESVRFTVETHLTLGNADEDRTLARLFEKGGLDVWRLVEEGKRLFNAAGRTAAGFGSVAYKDTMDAIGGFFRVYDLRFFAHDIPCMIDYPLCLPVPDRLKGICFINDYLRRIILENRFCLCFDRRAAARLLTVCRPDYKELILNLFEPLFLCALGHAVLGRNIGDMSLGITDAQMLYSRFRPWDDGKAKACLHEAVNKLCVYFGLWDSAMRAYLAQAAHDQMPILKSASLEGYENMFGVQR
ncbi:MAG: DUF6179 domain-containing protein [Oscillospiraceae bacterium]|nr:DUF6179 domain-containing protein [Oscillospiraceae bacterium]